MLALYLIYLLFVFKRIVEIFVIVLLFSVLFRVLTALYFLSISCCSIFKDHRLAVVSATCILYHISKLLSRGFAKVFFNFFQALAFFALGRFCDDLDIISYFQSLVKRFSQSFLKFFQTWLCFAFLADSLYSIPHPRRFVNTFRAFFATLAF